MGQDRGDGELDPHHVLDNLSLGPGQWAYDILGA